MIHRAEHAEGFTTISNALLRDDSLGFEARGFLSYMLTMSDDWVFSIKGLAFQTNLAEWKVMQLVTKLKKAGYIIQRRAKNEKGQFTTCDWDLYEVPQSIVRKNHTQEKPQCGKTTVKKNQTKDDPQCGKILPIRNTNSKEIPIERNNKGKEEKAAPFAHILEPLSPELQKVFSDFVQMRKTIKAPLTEKALDLAIKKAYKLADDDPQKVKAIVEQSILNSWRGLFALKENEGHCAPPEPTNEIDWDEVTRLAYQIKEEGGTA